MRNITFSGLLLFLLFSTTLSIAQEVEIKLGPQKIALNEYFTITITVKNGQLKSYSQFPEIPGFDKRGISNQSTTNIVNGRMSQQLSLIQNYQARKTGKYTLKPFEIAINGVAVPHDGGSIEVGAAKQQRQQSWDPFEDFFGQRNAPPQEFVEVQDDAFFAVTTDKQEVYSGEGLNLQMAFYVAESNRAQMEFHDINAQLTELIQKVKPANCWEENFEVTEIKPENVTIGQKKYRKYKLYEATLYPLGVQDITLPSLPFKMVKYKVAKQQRFFGRNHQKDFKTYYSQAKKIRVKPLPEHPLRDQVAVGNYRLLDELPKDSFQTGESFNYSFKIVGEGNIAAIKAPEILEQQGLQIYPPDELQDISRSNSRVAGKKEFRYYIIPEEPGSVAFSKVFQWIFFNPTTAKYDTLSPSGNAIVYGESQKDAAILSSDLGVFYDRIAREDTTLIDLSQRRNYVLWIQLMLVLLAGTIIWKYFRIK